MRKLPCRVSGVVSSARTHARTHAPARTHAHTRARAHTHTQAHARRRCPYPTRQPRARGQGAPPHWASILGLPTSAQGLGSPPPTSALGANAATTVHLHRGSHCPHLRRDCAQPLPTSSPGLGSLTAHICAGTWLSHCPHLRRDCAQPLPTSAPRLRSATAHICAGTALAHCPHRHRAHNLPTSRLPRNRKCVRPMVRAVPVCLCEANAVCICSFYADSPCCSVA